MPLPMRPPPPARRDQQMVVHRVEEAHRHVGQITERGAHVMHDKIRLLVQLLEPLLDILMREQRLAARGNTGRLLRRFEFRLLNQLGLETSSKIGARQIAQIARDPQNRAEARIRVG